MTNATIDELEVERLRALAASRSSAVKELLTELIDKEYVIERLALEAERLRRQVMTVRRQKRKLMSKLREYR